MAWGVGCAKMTSLGQTFCVVPWCGMLMPELWYWYFDPIFKFYSLCVEHCIDGWNTCICGALVQFGWYQQRYEWGKGSVVL